ncbi:LacI family DNA-binding transcriptional regulator [Bifidobacterium sp. UTBIF-78]|uniref:LacI family DNA-binding transcriptional regulator n=1 Tax=Bifidobacterium sp. UTBIF-78 TaxID=1465263 RepID=UPI00112DB38F|nr:LacI family DNA-binding transcriptional regulator [Bifidobacterium sp. UTBIF-78]TPF95058.1 LacI family transcriptional regulator [Bifidobacterium sp. UTBIF-78]
MERATIADVAKAAGVSVSTASRALRGTGRVSQSTRERVAAEAERLRFMFSKSAASLASGRTMRVALLLPNEISRWFNSHVFEGVYEELASRDYDVVPYVIWDERDLDAFLRELPGNRNVDAVIVCSFDMNEAQSEALAAFSLPVVGVNTPSDRGYDATVRIDDAAAMLDAVRLLKSLGHKRLAYVTKPLSPSPFVSSGDVRVAGFRQAARICGYDEADVTVIPPLKAESMSRPQDVYSGIAARLVSAPEPPTGICVSADFAAMLLLKELRRLGRRVPQAISVIGFDDDDTAIASDLTTLHQSPTELGREAAQLALALMDGKTPAQPYVMMPTSLVLRDTTAAVDAVVGI